MTKFSFAWVALLTGLAITVGTAAPVKFAEEKLPKATAAAVTKQVHDYFKKADIKGLPLVDPATNWNDLKAWPKEFTFQGSTYSLVLMNWKGQGEYEKLGSANDIKDGMKLVASYEIVGNPPADFLILNATWNEDGSLHDRGMLFGSKQVFFLQFYPSGQLYMASREDAKSAETVIEYFDRSGAVAGVQRGQDRKWGGAKVTEAVFNSKKDELLK